jgi:hypothetical protein
MRTHLVTRVVECLHNVFKLSSCSTVANALVLCTEDHWFKSSQEPHPFLLKTSVFLSESGTVTDVVAVVMHDVTAMNELVDSVGSAVMLFGCCRCHQERCTCAIQTQKSSMSVSIVNTVRNLLVGSHQAIRTSLSGILGTTTVTVDGVTYTGNNSAVIDTSGQLFIDGQKVSDDLNKSAKIEISVTGSVQQITTATGNVSITNGSVQGYISTTSGDVTIHGNAARVSSTSGDISVTGDVSGSCSTVSGDIQARTIEGSCSTVSGEIQGRRS